MGPAAAGHCPAVNASVGTLALGFELLAVFEVQSGLVAVLERTFARWGFLSYVAEEGGGGGELARLRKGVGAVTVSVCLVQALHPVPGMVTVNLVVPLCAPPKRCCCLHTPLCVCRVRACALPTF